MVNMTKDITQQELNVPLTLVEANNIKFLKPILPVEKNVFTLSLKITEDDLVKVVATCSSEEEKLQRFTEQKNNQR